MTRPPTVKEDADHRFELWKKTNEDRWTFGRKPSVLWGPFVNPADWLVSAGCNLFHADDLAAALLDLHVPFAVCWVQKRERDHTCIVALQPMAATTHYVRVHASGYGTGEAMYFSKQCPARLRFRLCRALALTHTAEMIKHYAHSVEGGVSRRHRGKLWQRIRANETWALAELQAFQTAVETTVRTYADLTRVAARFHTRARRWWKIR